MKEKVFPRTPSQKNCIGERLQHRMVYVFFVQRPLLRPLSVTSFFRGRPAPPFDSPHGFQIVMGDLPVRLPFLVGWCGGGLAAPALGNRTGARQDLTLWSRLEGHAVVHRKKEFRLSRSSGFNKMTKIHCSGDKGYMRIVGGFCVFPRDGSKHIFFACC